MTVATLDMLLTVRINRRFTNTGINVVYLTIQIILATKTGSKSVTSLFIIPRCPKVDSQWRHGHRQNISLPVKLAARRHAIHKAVTGSCRIKKRQ
jgi:hypothetical protein